MLDELFAIGHIRPEIIRDDEFASVPVKASSRKNEFGTIVEVLKVTICEFSTLPEHGLPVIQQRYAAAR